MTKTKPEISIVIPVFNEAANLEPLLSGIVKAMETDGRSFEMIAVDDGSRDESFAVLQRLHERDDPLCVVRLMRNFGQHPATPAA